MSSERFIESTGESVEEAISKGLEELGVDPNQVIVEVLEEPSRGMFGIGARPARVRLQLLIVSSSVEKEQQPVSVVDEPEEEFVEDEVVELDEDAEVARVVLTELLEKMSIRAQVKVSKSEKSQGEEEAPWLLNVTGGGDLRSLIGRRGETLSSLQYITRLITSRELQRRANIVVDVDNYKSSRTDKLFELANRMADQAISQNRTISLEPMPPYERRIIHLALRNHPDVTTRSVGEGNARKVTIVPN
ncbi:MAG: protein jag [Anaerolineae bacterium]|nr:protein jag [Anaerolineae bacterium]